MSYIPPYTLCILFAISCRFCYFNHLWCYQENEILETFFHSVQVFLNFFRGIQGKNGYFKSKCQEVALKVCNEKICIKRFVEDIQGKYWREFVATPISGISIQVFVHRCKIKDIELTRFLWKITLRHICGHLWWWEKIVVNSLTYTNLYPYRYCWKFKSIPLYFESDYLKFNLGTSKLAYLAPIETLFLFTASLNQ